MLRKMCLVSAEKFSREALKKSPPLVSSPKKSPHPPPSKKKSKTRKREKQHPYHKWVNFPKKMVEADITRKTRMKAIADILQKVLPERASPCTETVVKEKKKNQSPPMPLRHFDDGTQTEQVAIPSTSAV